MMAAAVTKAMVMEAASVGVSSLTNVLYTLRHGMCLAVFLLNQTDPCSKVLLLSSIDPSIVRDRFCGHVLRQLTSECALPW